MRGPGRAKPLILIDNRPAGVEVACAAEACILEIVISAVDVA
jgi:hypothetical protein